MLTKTNDVYTIEAEIGEHITSFCAKLSRLALQTKQEVTGTFNGVQLIADVNTTAQQLTAKFHQQLRIDQENYEKSPEYAIKLKQREKELAAINKRIEKCMNEFSELNWDSYAAILKWLSNIQPLADHTGVSLDRSKIIAGFENHGFKANENTGDSFNGENPENHARYIIGQAIDGFLTVGAPHPILVSFVEKWIEKHNNARVITDANII